MSLTKSDWAVCARCNKLVYPGLPHLCTIRISRFEDVRKEAVAKTRTNLYRIISDIMAISAFLCMLVGWEIWKLMAVITVYFLARFHEVKGWNT